MTVFNFLIFGWTTPLSSDSSEAQILAGTWVHYHSVQKHSGRNTTISTSSGKMYSRHRDKERRWIRLKEFPCLVREHVICMFSPFLPSQFNAGMFDANKICIKSGSIKSPFHTSSISSSFTRGRMTGLLNQCIHSYLESRKTLSVVLDTVFNFRQVKKWSAL